MTRTLDVGFCRIDTTNKTNTDRFPLPKHLDSGDYVHSTKTDQETGQRARGAGAEYLYLTKRRFLNTQFFS
jgi:hypothetical protein